MEQINCTICASPGTILYDCLTDRSTVSSLRWTLMRCGNERCRLIWINPTPGPDELANAYGGVYYTHALDKETVYSRLKLRVKMGRLGEILGYLNYLQGFEKGRLLDVGCGNGRFLSAMRELGWEVEGVEPDCEAAALAQNAFGLNVQKTSLEEASLEPESFDVITLNHIIEHVRNPTLFLSKCFELLKGGGEVLLRTPNAESVGHRLFKESWQPLDVPRHLYIYSSANIITLAKEAGFGIRLIRTVPRDAHVVFLKSKAIKEARRPLGAREGNNAMDTAAGALFLVFEFLALARDSFCGEELVLFLSK